MRGQKSPSMISLLYTLFIWQFVGANRSQIYDTKSIVIPSLIEHQQASHYLLNTKSMQVKQKRHDDNDIYLKKIIADIEHHCLAHLTADGPHYQAASQLIELIVSSNSKSNNNHHNQDDYRKINNKNKSSIKNDEQLFLINNYCDLPSNDNDNNNNNDSNDVSNNDNKQSISLATVIGNELVELGVNVHKCLCSMLGMTASNGQRRLISRPNLNQLESTDKSIIKWPPSDCITENCMLQQQLRKRRNVSGNQGHHQGIESASLVSGLECIDSNESIDSLDYDQSTDHGTKALNNGNNNKCRPRQQDSLIDFGEAIARQFAQLIAAERAARGATKREHYYDTHYSDVTSNNQQYSTSDDNKQQGSSGTGNDKQVFTNLWPDPKSYVDYSFTHKTLHQHANTDNDNDNDNGDGNDNDSTDVSDNNSADRNIVTRISKRRNNDYNDKLSSYSYRHNENKIMPSEYLMTNSNKRHSSTSSTSGAQHPLMVSSVMDLLRAKVIAEGRRKISPLDSIVVEPAAAQMNLIELGGQTIAATNRDNNKEKNRRPNSDNNNLLMVIG
ncbi:hypothetical protein GZH46_01654 [Fragariocoptes setiger]|uniref:Uncharacterized protein n=1 Tax=Fragariocoptes setiger TaxID=1670756 RepID=A0ABQ7S8R8_9ACAR|nr:hypothetical protein GZH46_01654 [Fragariocoptes setiger]